MIMITGGAFQGKTEYVKKQMGFTEMNIVDGKSCDPEEVMTAKCVKNYHLLVRRLLADGIDPVEYTKRLCSENSDASVIIDEIGCGIIPLEKSERIWREMTGRAGCVIAEYASAVIRISCGIPVVLKGATR